MAGRLRPRLRVLQRRLQASTARDITASLAGRTALVIAPHPDDETLGCGGTAALIARSGGTIAVLVVSDGGEGNPPGDLSPGEFADVREQECIQACARLGIGEDTVTFLRLPDANLREHRTDIAAAIGRVARDTDPAVVLAPLAEDAHEDHRVVGGIVRDLIGSDLAGRLVLGYPVWFWNRWAWTSRDRSAGRQRRDLLVNPARACLSTRWRKVRIDDLLEVKRHALDAHASQVGRVLDEQWLQQFLHRDELFLELGRGDR